MFLRDALQRCSQLESEVAAAYDTLSAATDLAPAVKRAWLEAARRERRRAALLRSLAEVSLALGDDGPFLVHVTQQLAGLHRVLDGVRARIAAALDSAAAERCVEQLEATPRDELYRTLLEVAEPMLRRVLRLVESESRSLRRAAAEAAKAKDAGKARPGGAAVNP